MYPSHLHGVTDYMVTLRHLMPRDGVIYAAGGVVEEKGGRGTDNQIGVSYTVLSPGPFQFNPMKVLDPTRLAPDV